MLDQATARSAGVAYLLWAACFLGACGLHRFYTRRYVTGTIWLLTFGLLGIGQFVDLFLVDGLVRSTNYEEALRRAENRWIRDSLTRPQPV